MIYNEQGLQIIAIPVSIFERLRKMTKKDKILVVSANRMRRERKL